MNTPLQVAQLLFDHYATGDVEAILGLAHPDVLLETEEEGRSQGRYEGHEGLRRIVSESADQHEGEIETFDFTEQEDKVVVVGWRRRLRDSARGRESRAWVLEVRDGKLEKMTITPHRGHAMRMAGLQ